ncbi:MAG: hypothetical protein P9L94_11515 [Candidatus Hinthialibacter antarcticus]|nr:hypothetical protein [Candidatus Hinthialibacter antarcticus]
MPFVSEQELRKQTFLRDYDSVPSEQLRESLQQAHEEILAQTTLTDDSPVNAAIARAEINLTLAVWFQAKAAATAVNAQDLTLTGVRINEHSAVESQLALADRFREEAWGMLAPYSRSARPAPLQMAREEA